MSKLPRFFLKSTTISGAYTCGATLVNPQWLLTHRSCAQEAMPQDGVPEKFAVARLGAYLDNPTLNFLSGHEQVMVTFSFYFLSPFKIIFKLR